MKLRRLKSSTTDKVGQKFADFRKQINILTDEIEKLKEENSEFSLFQSLLEGTTEDKEFYLLDLIDRLKKEKKDRKSHISIE